MPYKLSKRGAKFCVVNKDTGESKGCSDSRAKAVAHMRALYYHEGKSKKEIDSIVAKELLNMEIVEEVTDDKELYEYDNGIAPLYYGIPTSFEELERLEESSQTMIEINETISEFPMLVRNIMDSVTIEDKIGAINNLTQELTERLSSYTKESSDEKGIRESEPLEDTIFKKVITKIKEFFHKEDGDEPLMIWKEADGTWKWIARYSNTFRDRDNPPEIIASSSHRRFVELVDKGLAPLPVIQIWHVKEWTVGKADHVAYDEVGNGVGFAIATGHFNRGSEQVAEWLSTKGDLKVSHGMPVSTIKRDETDKSIIIEHETAEISVLPDWAAANELTGFVSFKEVDMAIPEDKRKKLAGWGLSEELIGAIESLNQKDAEEAVDKGVESKEIEPQAEETETVKEETPVEETATEVPAETVLSTQNSLTREEVAEAMRMVVESVQQLSEKVVVLSEEIKELKVAKEDAVQETVRKSTNASLMAMITGRAIDDDANLVDGRSNLAKSKPKETASVENRTGIPFIDQMLTQ